MYKDTKPMLTPFEQIQHLESKGVKFELINKEDAQKYLEDNNNYFKLTSYRKNFPKYMLGENAGKYINLDFKMLIDLAIIDMKIRKAMLSIVLDLEHYVKVKLLAMIEKGSKDGYTINDNSESIPKDAYIKSDASITWVQIVILCLLFGILCCIIMFAIFFFKKE